MRCEIGINAFIIKPCHELEFLRGHVCKVIARGPQGYADWQVKLTDSDFRLVLKLHPWTRNTLIDDDALLPIRPDETPEQSIEAMKLLTSIKEKV